MEKMRTIAIVVAMQSEFDLVRHIVKDAEDLEFAGNPCAIGNMDGKRIILLKSGIGKVCAGVQVAELIGKYSPDFIVNSGVAGGIGKGIRQGDIVIGERCVYHDVWCGEGEWGQVQGYPLMFEGDAHMLEVMRTLENGRLRFGLICTGDQFIADEAALDVIKGRFPAGEAVDMESAAMAHVCHMRGVPFMSLRVISDTPGMEEDNTSQYMDFFKEAPKMTFKVLEEMIAKI